MRIQFIYLVFLPVFSFLSAKCALSQKFYDQEGLAATAADPVGVVEPAVPITHSDMSGAPTPVGSRKVIELNDQVPGTGSFPTTVVDLVSSGFIRLTPQAADGSTSSAGTSVLRSPGFRTPDNTIHVVPNVNVSAAVFTRDGTDRYRSEITGNIQADASNRAAVNMVTKFPDPAIGTTTVSVSSAVTFLDDVALANTPGDRLRLATFSSSFIGTRMDSTISFDADLIRYEDMNGVTQSLQLNDQTQKDALLFSDPQSIGSWVELVKTKDDTFNPGSPSMRIDISDHSPNAVLGLQGFLQDTQDPANDSLQVWLEVVNSPDTILANTSYSLDYTISATTTAVPEPRSVFVFATIIATCAFSYRKRKRIAEKRTPPQL